MDFLRWLQVENNNLADFGQGSPTPASDQVKRTGLQPQVDAQDIKTKSKAEQDKISAVDSQLERVNEILSSVNDEDHPKLAQFKNMWEKLLSSWDGVKFGDEQGEDGGLGSHEPNERLLNMMKQNQPLPHNNVPAGPGTFGMS